LWTFILTAISISLFHGVEAATLDFTTPSEATLGSAFNVSISYSLNESYDVKIFVQSSENKTISEIFSSGKWVNPYNYLVGAYPSSSTFQIRVKSQSDYSSICLRLRKTGSKSSVKEACNAIVLKEENHDDSGTNESEETHTDEKNESETKIVNETKKDERVEKNTSYIPLAATHNDEKPVEKIVLSTPVKENPKELIITKEEMVRRWVIYSFAGLCILMIILLSFNRL
jgi:hypothetical protein